MQQEPQQQQQQHHQYQQHCLCGTSARGGWQTAPWTAAAIALADVYLTAAAAAAAAATPPGSINGLMSPTKKSTRLVARELASGHSTVAPVRKGTRAPRCTAPFRSLPCNC